MDMIVNEFLTSEGVDELIEEEEEENIQQIDECQELGEGAEQVDDDKANLIPPLDEQIEEDIPQELGGAEKVDDDAITSIHLLFPEEMQEDVRAPVEVSEEYQKSDEDEANPVLLPFSDLVIVPRDKLLLRPLERYVDTHGIEKTQVFIDSLQKKKDGFEEFLPEASCLRLLPIDSDVQTERDEDGLSEASTIDYFYPEDESEDEVSEGEYSEDESDSSPPPCNYREVTDFSKPVSKWVDSWNDGRKHGSWTWVHVYAYFNRDKGYGGYGVLIRNALGVPIVSSAKFSRVGNSLFYQVFKGINAGVALAEVLGIETDLHIRCNSKEVPLIYRYVRCCCGDECIAASNLDKVCRSCYSHIMYHDSQQCNMRLVAPLILELRHKEIGDDLLCDWGIAAHIVAKIEKVRILNDTNDDGSGEIEPMGHVIKPDDFTPRLKRILWRDSFSMLRNQFGRNPYFE